jgi:hypothetical protein
MADNMLTELANIESRAEIKVIKADRNRLIRGVRMLAARHISGSAQTYMRQQIQLLDALLRGEDITEEVG